MKFLTQKIVGNYYVVRIKGRMMYVNRFVLMTFKPIKAMGKMKISHNDKNTLNNHISNLKWTTASESILGDSLKKIKAFNKLRKMIDKVATLKGEIWKSVSGYEGLYLVSNFGRIKSLRVQSSGEVKGRECLFKCKPRKDGYCRVQLKTNGTDTSYYAHILVAKAFLPNPKKFTKINHIDGDRANNKVVNLEWVAELQSKQGLLKKQVGETHSQSKLKESDVREIRNLYFIDRFTYKEIASLYNIHYSTVGYIINGKLWKHKF